MMMSKVRIEKRVVDGFLILDKPPQGSSNAVLQLVKRLFKAQKAGHSGTLDPIASGLFPICLGEATKFVRFLLSADKHYQVTAKLGVRTETGDTEGKIIAERAVPKYSLDDLEIVLDRFRGVTMQIPSMYSALKLDGQPLYKLARLGVEVPREAREITVHDLSILSFENDLLCLDIKASKGTYVRNLVEDLGEALGCGAHVVALRRLASGPYTESMMVGLPELLECEKNEGTSALDRYLLPIESALPHLPKLILADSASYYLLKGQPVWLPQAPTTGWVSLFNKDERFLGVGEVLDDGRVAPRRLLTQNS